MNQFCSLGRICILILCTVSSIGWGRWRKYYLKSWSFWLGMYCYVVNCPTLPAFGCRGYGLNVNYAFVWVADRHPWDNEIYPKSLVLLSIFIEAFRSALFSYPHFLHMNFNRFLLLLETWLHRLHSCEVWAGSTKWTFIPASFALYVMKSCSCLYVQLLWW